MLLEFFGDILRHQQQVSGSDGRLNVSSRSDNRAYYNARDEGRAFNLTYDHQTAAPGEFCAYWKNTDPNLQLVISSIGANVETAARVELHRVTGTVAGGEVITPINPTPSSNSANAVCRQGLSSDALTGLTSDGRIDFIGIGPTSHEEFRLHDVVRLGQNQAVALKMFQGTTDLWGVMFGYYELKGKA